LLGEALAPMRGKVVIATKFGFQDGETAKGLDSRPGFPVRIIVKRDLVLALYFE